MKTKLLYFSLFLFLVSCRGYPQKDIQGSGVFVTCPEGWKSKVEKIAGSAYSIVLEKAGYGASGLLDITWMPDDIDPDTWLESFKNELKTSVIYRNADLTFGKKERGHYGLYQVVTQTFSANVFGLPHQGQVYSFQKGGKSFLILKQEASEDHAENKAGYMLIEKSFRVNG